MLSVLSLCQCLWGVKMSINYGVNIGESVVSVMFGDGRTAIQPLGFADGTCGVVLCRDGKHDEPFGANEARGSYKSDEDKVFIRFDNKRSIDVLIESLMEAKEFMAD